MGYRKKHRAGLKKRAKILQAQLDAVQRAIQAKLLAAKKPRITSIESGHFLHPEAIQRLPQPETSLVVAPELVDSTIDDKLDLHEDASNENSPPEVIDISSPAPTIYEPTIYDDETDVETETIDAADENDRYASTHLTPIDSGYIPCLDEPSQYDACCPDSYENRPLYPSLEQQDRVIITEWFTKIDTYARTVFGGQYSQNLLANCTDHV